jgi:hypothetical protein
MPGTKTEEDILLLRHIDKLDHKARFDKRLGTAGREKRLLERTYLMHQKPYASRNHAKMLRKAADALLDSEIEASNPLVLRRRMGKEGVRKGIEAYNKAFPDLKMAITKIVARDDTVIVRNRICSNDPRVIPLGSRSSGLVLLPRIPFDVKASHSNLAAL